MTIDQGGPGDTIEYAEEVGFVIAIVLHLHAHTKGLDDLIDRLAAE